MICFPNAKINLGLNIVEKRPDGYHNLETIFYPVPLKDALEIVESPVFSFSQTGIAVDACPEDNLIIRALRLLEKDFSIPELSIHLLKAIPFGAGLGGGSSDAACMLKLLNEYCSLGLSVQQLEEKASLLGADCPFFIRNTPVFATGTGNLFEPVDVSLSGYFFCLVKPEVIVSTPEAYSLIKPAKPAISLKEIVSLPIHEWKEKMINDFEEVVFQKYPFIREIKNNLYHQGALYAAMSGSGSSVFGIFEKKVSLKEIFATCYVWEGELP